jgi:membrane protein implicated in regulation of membrane protease activity
MALMSSRLSVYLYRHYRVRLLIEAITVSFAAYFAAVASNWISDYFRTEGLVSVLIRFVAVVIVSALVLFLFWIFQTGPDAELQSRTKILLNARSQLDEALAAKLARVERLDPYRPADGRAEAELSIESHVRGLYRCLDANYADSDVPGSRVNFEVTFMTRDYSDNFVTIMSWANRDGRAPRSLAQRTARPDIYDATVTAQVYREAADRLPSLRIIEDTQKTPDYSELYSGQKSRIRSSVVYPVFNSRNILLGTLVSHCDRAGFFRERNQKYWRELNDMFALRIAVEKTKLDALHTHSPSAGDGAHVDAGTPALPTPKPDGC